MHLYVEEAQFEEETKAEREVTVGGKTQPTHKSREYLKLYERKAVDVRGD